MSDCYCISLRTAARKVTAIYDEALVPVGVNLAQFSMLRRIDRAGAVSLTELGRICELERSTVGRNVKILERMQLVRSTRGEDQREAMVSLSERGRRTIGEGAPLWDRAQRRVEQALGGDKAASLLGMLQNL